MFPVPGKISRMEYVLNKWNDKWIDGWMEEGINE